MKQGWEEKKLDELFNVQSSKRVHKSDWKDEGIPFYRAREVVKLAKDGFVQNDLYISNELFNEFTKEKGAPKKGDIVVSAVGTLGRCYLVKENDLFYIKDASVLWLSKISNVHSKYIKYAFDSDLILKQVFYKSMGATVATLTITRAKNILIPIPPLDEQKRIVSKLDQCFKAIDKARANVEKNLNNAKELFQSKLNEIFSQRGDGWVEKKLGEVYDVRDGTHDSPKYHDEGYPLITSKNLKNDAISFEKIKLISELDFININKRSKVNIGDVLFAMIGTIGNPVVVVEEPHFAIKNVALFKVSQSQHSQFLKYYLDSDYVIKKMGNEAKGSTQKFVGLGYLRNFPILLPPFDRQESIVKELDNLKSQTQSLESNYQKELDALDELKKSILQKAFNGEL